MANILENIGAARNSFFVLSLTDYNPGIWFDPQQLRLSIGGRGRQARNFRDVYVWDMYRLAESVGEDALDGLGHYTVPADLEQWSPIWIKSFNDDAGSRLHLAVQTPFAVDFLETPRFNEESYAGGFSFSPLVGAPVLDDEGNPTLTAYERILSLETFQAENILHKAMAIPAYPLLLSSSLPAHAHYGPLLMSTASISVSGSRALKSVDVTVQFQGSKSMKMPVMERREPLVVDVPIPASDLENTLAESQADTPSDSQASTKEYLPYRFSNLLDCRCYTGVYTLEEITREDAKLDDLLRLEAETKRVIEMEIKIVQSVKWEYTQPTVERGQQNGARWGAVASRTVTGSLQFYSLTEEITFPEADAMTLYFGGVWIFPMANIRWQRPVVEATPGVGYTHTYNFMALATPDTVSKPYVAKGYPVSEFYLAPS